MTTAAPERTVARRVTPLRRVQRFLHRHAWLRLSGLLASGYKPGVLGWDLMKAESETDASAAQRLFKIPRWLSIAVALAFMAAAAFVIRNELRENSPGEILTVLPVVFESAMPPRNSMNWVERMMV